MTFSDSQIPAKGATSPDIEFDVLIDSGTGRVTPKMADIAARASLASLDGKTPVLGQALAAESVPVVLTALQEAALAQDATVAEVATSLASLDGKTPVLGQALAAESVPVVLTALQLAELAQDATVGAIETSLGGDGATPPTIPGTGVRGWLRSIYDWIKAVFVSQGSTTAGQSGPLVQGAVVSADQAYTAGQTSPLTVTPTGRLRVGLSSAGSVTGGSAGINSDLIGGTFRSSPATLTDAQQAALLLDALGRLQVRNTDLGAQADAAAGSDTATASLVGLVKRELQTLTTVVASLTSLITNTTPAANGNTNTAGSRCFNTASDDPNFGPLTTQAGVSLTGAGTYINQQDVSQYIGCWLHITGNGTGFNVAINGGNVTSALTSVQAQSAGQISSAAPSAGITSNQLVFVPLGFQYLNVALTVITGGTVTVTPTFVKRAVNLASLPTSMSPLLVVNVGPTGAGRGQNPATTGGPTNLKTSATVLNAGSCHNKNVSTPAFFHLYNKASAPTVGTDTPAFTYPCPANMPMPFSIGCGPAGRRFSTGLGVAMTTDFAGATGVSSAGDVTYDLNFV